MTDPLTVACPDCIAPVGTPCSSRFGDLHKNRQIIADLRALELGTCDLCGRPMVRGKVTGREPDVWHPDPADAARCPSIPDPRIDWNGYARAIQAGATPGRPGPEHFIPSPEKENTNE